MLSGVRFGRASVHDDGDELATLSAACLGHPILEVIYFLGREIIQEENVRDDTRKGCLHGRNMPEHSLLHKHVDHMSLVWLEFVVCVDVSGKKWNQPGLKWEFKSLYADVLAFFFGVLLRSASFSGPKAGPSTRR